MRQFQELLGTNREFFVGVVTASDAGSFTVQVAPADQRGSSFLSGIPLASCLAGLLGVKESILPQPGATVFCYKRDAFSCLVLGVIPEPDSINKESTYPVRSVIGAGDGISNETNTIGYAGAGVSKMATQNANRPTDIVGGELALSNEFGVMLGLFQTFATLKASELAQVQAFVLDDLVRIVSHNFQHFTSMGETKIYQDGKSLNMEIGLTNDPIEATGLPHVDNSNNGKTTIVFDGKTSIDDKDDFFHLEINKPSEDTGENTTTTNEKLTGIERFRGFIGSLGDFVHLIFSAPHPTQQRALDGTKTGNYDKGLASLKMEMDGSVYLRSASAIGFEKSNWIRVPQRINAPEETVEAKEPTTLQQFKFDSSTASKDEIPFLYFLQLRDYLSHLQDGKAYQQFTDSNKFELNNEGPNKETQFDKVAPNKPVKFEKKTAGMYIMPNGGIMLRDAWGSALVMEGGNIYVQPAKDLTLQPLRNIVAKVGGLMSVAVKNDIEFSSTDGGYRLKTNDAQYLYSDKSGIIVHSNATSPSEYYPRDGAITSIGGIVLHAPEAAITTHSKYSLFKTDEHAVTKANNIMLDSNKSVLIRCDDSIDLFSKGSLLVEAQKQLVLHGDTQAIFVGETSTFVGKVKQTFGMSGMGPVMGLMTDKTFEEWRTRIDDILEKDFQEFSPVFRDDNSFDDLKFRFPASDRYGVNASQDFIPQTIAQQEDVAFKRRGYKRWEETPVNDTYPYPGKERKQCYARAGLYNLQFDEDTSDIYNKPTEHNLIGKIDVGDLFTEYTSYGN